MFAIGPNYGEDHKDRPFVIRVYSISKTEETCWFKVTKSHLEAIMRQCQAAILIHEQWGKPADQLSRDDFIKAIMDIDENIKPRILRKGPTFKRNGREGFTLKDFPTRRRPSKL